MQLQEDAMKATLKKVTAALGVVLIGAILTATAKGECGSPQLPKGGRSIQPQSWRGAGDVGPASLLLASEHESDETIVGFWKVTAVAKGNPDIPDGVVLDNAYTQFHSDGTEITNSSRPPVTSSFCLGVWKKVGPSHYRLNHFAISWDQNSNPVGPANLREDIVVSPDGKTFTATFSVNQFDQSGNVMAHVTGQANGRRITVNTPASDVM
jgi:hypothetical protein